MMRGCRHSRDYDSVHVAHDVAAASLFGLGLLRIVNGATAVVCERTHFAFD